MAKKSIRICERDNYTCQICGKKITNYTYEGQLDHLIPKSQGGSSSEDNLNLTCCSCNNKRNNRANKTLLISLICKLKDSIDSFDFKLLKYELNKGGISKSEYESFVCEFEDIAKELINKLYKLKEGV